jgi:hypothetical protein
VREKLREITGNNGIFIDDNTADEIKQMMCSYLDKVTQNESTVSFT